MSRSLKICAQVESGTIVAGYSAVVILHSPGLFVRNKFYVLCLDLPKYLMELLVYSVTVFCLSIPERKVCHKCTNPGGGEYSSISGI